MSKVIRMGKLNVSFNFQNKLKPKRMLEKVANRYELGFFYKKSKIVGVTRFENPNEWGDNLVNDYILGVNLIVYSLWVNWHVGGMVLSLKEK